MLAIFLSACSKKSPKTNTLPSAKTILTKAQKTNYPSLAASWSEKANGALLQKAEVKYSAKPTVVYANVSAVSNHYQMWAESKNSYIQMKGTNTNHWFKTSANSGTYSSFIQSLNGSLLTPFIKLQKQFKVNKQADNYVLVYQGNNKKVWNAIISDSSVTTLMGIDTNDVKPINNKIQITLNKDYQVTNVNVVSSYKDDGQKKVLTMKVDQIGKVKNLSIPKQVKTNAVDLGEISKK